MTKDRIRPRKPKQINPLSKLYNPLALPEFIYGMISNLENAIDCNNLSCMPKIGSNLYTATARIISIVLHFRKYHI
jgi:hypothetical protein